ncbi:hypothetical protein B0H63DRAFT_462853 [Podospora didyma]|uniref:Uncharacterized protein n=1 Tax=Podospora didyma TaxID=330526 RepID=A0AAE0U8Z9_9PEZI|nr:hypothetical protein B0H63DRAFT_462853 [Podospora didyma]
MAASIDAGLAFLLAVFLGVVIWQWRRGVRHRRRCQQRDGNGNGNGTNNNKNHTGGPMTTDCEKNGAAAAGECGGGGLGIVVHNTTTAATGSTAEGKGN